MKELPGLPKMQMPIVDVRDVAEAHLQGLLRPEAANKRFLLVADSVWFQALVTRSTELDSTPQQARPACKTETLLTV